MISNMGEVYLVDYGLCIIEGVKVHQRSGTFAFASPEVLFDSTYTSKSNIWALGITMLHMLSTEFCNYADEAVWDLIISNKKPGTDITLPTKIQNFLDMCLEFDPKGYVPHCHLDDSVCLRLNIFFRRFLDFVIRFSAGLHTYLDVQLFRTFLTCGLFIVTEFDPRRKV